MSQMTCIIWLYLKFKFKARCATRQILISGRNPSVVLRHLVFTVDEASLKYLNYEWMRKHVPEKYNFGSNIINDGWDWRYESQSITCVTQMSSEIPL